MRSSPPRPASTLEKIQRKFRAREWTTRDSPRIRTGATKEDQKVELKKDQTRRCYVKKPRFVFDPTHHTPDARRGTRNHRSGIPAIAGRQGSTAHRTDRADDQDARGEVTRDRNTKNSRRPVFFRTTQRPRSANKSDKNSSLTLGLKLRCVSLLLLDRV